MLSGKKPLVRLFQCLPASLLQSVINTINSFRQFQIDVYNIATVLRQLMNMTNKSRPITKCFTALLGCNK